MIKQFKPRHIATSDPSKVRMRLDEYKFQGPSDGREDEDDGYKELGSSRTCTASPPLPLLGNQDRQPGRAISTSEQHTSRDTVTFHENGLTAIRAYSAVVTRC